MMFPITDQAQLDEIMSDRIKRERAKVHRKDAEELQEIINDLIDLKNKWKGTASGNERAPRT